MKKPNEIARNAAEAKSAAGAGSKPVAQKPKMGRPSSFTPELGERICDALVEGSTLTNICKEEWAPDRRTVSKWRRANSDFDREYLQARSAQMETFADECLDLAESGGDIQRVRLQIEARRVVLGRLAAVFVTGDTENAEAAELLQKARQRAVEVFDRIGRARERVGISQAVEEAQDASKH